jgi:hypothetical protein
VRIANIHGRAHPVTDGLALDAAEASGGRFGPGPQAVDDDWTAFSSWASDLIFTGTPAGVGMGRQPAEYLRAGQTLTTTNEGVGSITQRFHGQW